MTTRPNGPARRDGASKRVAGPRPRTLGRGPASGDGRIQVESGLKPRVRGAASQLPGLRGLARLGEAFALLPVIKRRVPRGAASVRGRKGDRRDGRLVHAVGRLPARGQAQCRRRADDRRARASRPRRSRCATPTSPPTTASSTRRSRRYEQGTDAADAPKEHERCGSNLVAPMLISTMAGNVIVRSVLGARGPVAGLAVTLAGVAASVEMFAWSERNSESPLAQAFRRPGYEMQRLFATREPTADQLDVGRAALDRDPPPRSTCRSGQISRAFRALRG